MPQLGETVTEGTITRWLKQVGDQVAEDEVLFEVSTDKVDSEVPSPASGYVTEILVPEGETVDVGVRLAVISSEAGQPRGDGGEQQAGDSQAGVRSSAVSPSGPDVADGSSSVTTQVEGPARPSGTDAGAGLARPVPPSGDTPTDAASAAVPTEPERADGGATDTGTRSVRVLSPVVRRLLADNGIDPGDVHGTGTGGRITRDDVLALVDQRGRAAATGPRPSPSPPAVPAARSTPPQPGIPARDGDEVIAFSNIRRRTAEHMVRSKATSAHTLVAVEADFEGIEVVRRSQRERFRAEQGISLTYLPFVARAVIEGLRAFPMLNASVGEDSLIVHRNLHLGIAVALDTEGLIVPVVHDADGKRLVALARQMADLAQRARTRRLGADDIAGGTFTITNPGPFGTLLTVPIINQPQVAILSTDGVKRRPVVVRLPDGGEAIAIHSVGNLALSFDHRAVDGAYAAGFLSQVRATIETRDWAQEL